MTDPTDPQHGLWIDGVRVADLPVVRTRLPVRDGAGKRRSWQYLLSAVDDGTTYLVSSKDLTSGEYADRVGIDVPEDRTIRDAAVTVIRSMGARAAQAELTSRWDDGKLVVPPIDALPQGYLETAGSEDDARTAWREICALACKPTAENLALNLGAAYAAPYPAALSNVRPVSFALVGVGKPRRGKSTNVNAAAGWYGAPILLNPPISESAIAITDSLASLGVLPFFRDENHAAKWTPEQWKQHWMTNLNGGGRRRSSADGSGIIRTTRGWWGIQWWSGNLDPRFGATDGVQARVIVLNDPHLPSKDDSKRITTLLGQSYGWPIIWQLANHPTPEAFRKLADRAYADLIAVAAAQDFVPDGAADTVAESLGVAVAGAELVGAMLDAPGLRAAAVRASLRVLRTLADSMADQAIGFGEQLLQDVLDDVQHNPGAWPAQHDYEAMRRETSTNDVGRLSRGEVHGFRHQHDNRPVVSMLRKRFTDVTSGRDYAVSEALSDLRRDGVLVADKGKGNQHQVKINDFPERFYTFRLTPAGEDQGDDVTEPPAPSPEAPMPTIKPPTGGEQDQPQPDLFDASATTEVRGPAVAEVPSAAIAKAWEPCVRCGRPTPVRRGGVPMHLDPCPPPLTTKVTEATSEPAAPVTATVAHPRGAHPAAVRRDEKRAAKLADDLAAMEAGEPLRLLHALETTHRPLLRGASPYLTAEMPGRYSLLRVVNSWAWSRPWSGPVVVLDRSGAWIAAAASVTVAHGELVHTGAAEFTGRPGMYEVAVYQWDEALLPNPLGFVEPGRETTWVPAPVVKRLTELVRDGRWPDASVLDSYTGDPVRLTVWAEYLKHLRTIALTKYGRDSDQYGEFKQAFGMATSLMLGRDNPGQGRKWECKAHRPDWTHAIQAQASMTLHRWADDCAKVAPEYAPVGIRNVDELVIPAPALGIVTTHRRPGDLDPLKIDELGVQLGTFKVKDELGEWNG